eukprot:gnl/Chilomastix_cuspidata/637.p1 GENE.gnl/Chilomastix_cuspidata/637~~gnl/Chilomastix_cuspidata/637.p1  ORF type:complete len:179 (+),score=39.57 gnl/Chilomastix_cuspidata/637:740-1276(+)
MEGFFPLTELVKTKYLLSEANLLNFFKNVAMGIREIHQSGLVHGNIGPKNILVNPVTHELLLTRGTFSAVLSDSTALMPLTLNPLHTSSRFSDISVDAYTSESSVGKIFKQQRVPGASESGDIAVISQLARMVRSVFPDGMFSGWFEELPSIVDSALGGDEEDPLGRTLRFLNGAVLV